MELLPLFLCTLLMSLVTEGRVYSRGYRAIARGQDCPAQCRCIALSHLGYRGMAQRWQSMGQLHGMDSPVWKGTDAPVWKESPQNLKGQDVVCMGLSKVPKPLPVDATKLTMYGDSSVLVDENGENLNNETQLTFLRDSSFGDGSQLRELTISGNNIHILYPFIFRALGGLQYIAMQNNNIRHISAAAFNGLDSLKELRLSDNMIGYLSTHVFTGLPNVRYLYLNGNKLRMLHRDLFRSMTSLEHLDLSRNNFTDFYDTVFDGAVNVRELLINENKLWVIRARWFQNLVSLRNLELEGNRITRIDPISFSTLLNLEHLSLSANIINTVSNEAFRNLTQLKTLDIAANDINKLEPNCFAGLDSLDELDLSVNRLSFIDNKTFDATPQLMKLDLSKNVVRDIEEAALHSLKSLAELDLSHNKLKKIKSKTFTGLLGLKEVNLEHNIISEVEDDAFVVASLNQFSMITWISLQYNRISQLGPYSLFGLPHLKFLNIGHNRIQKVDEKAFKSLGSLQNLLLNNNRIKALEDGIFSSLKHLSYLTLEGNKLSSISDNLFLGLKELDDLNMVLNGIETVSPSAFRHFPKLTRLDLRTNKISTFDFTDLILVKNLGYLDISSNRLFSVDVTNQKTHDLRHLILSNNNLRTLSSDVTNVLSPAGVMILSNNPWLCDCKIGWLPQYLAEYRIRLVGRGDTHCQTPSSLHGRRIDEVPKTDFICNNRTSVSELTCQHVQIRDAPGAVSPLRKGKNQARTWHVTFQDKNVNESCNGLLLNGNWAVTRRSCMRAHVPSVKENIKVKAGQKTSRELLLSLDYPNEADDAEFDLQLIRLAEQKNSEPSRLPCVLTHAQYHNLARTVAEVAFTARIQENGRRFRVKARTGRVMIKCTVGSGICVKVRGKAKDMDLQGSPLSIRYEGVWYSAGLGVHVNATDFQQQRFTPLWGVTPWLETAISEIDGKCQFQGEKNKRRTLCEGLQIPGVIDTKTFE